MLRLLTVLATCLLTLVPDGPSQAQSYPRRAIQLYVPYAVTSNAANKIATLVKKSMHSESGVDLLVLAPKGNDRTSILDVPSSSAATNGYQLMLAHARSHLIAPVLSQSSEVEQQPLLGVFATSPMFCVVQSNQRASTLKDLVVLARQDKKFRVSSAGRQSHSFLTAQLALRAAGLRQSFGHLALSSPAAALAAVLKGTATFACVPAPVAMQLVKSRQVNPLLASSALPGIDAPSAASLGFSGFEVLDEFAAIAGSKRVKTPVIDSWQGWLTRLSKNEKFIEQATKIGFRAGSTQLMLRAQANAVLARKRDDLAGLLKRYQITVKKR